MKKLTLDLNALAVQSFITADDGAPRFGTIHGRQQGPGPNWTGGPETACSLVEPECGTAENCPQDTGADCRAGTGDACTGSSCPQPAADDRVSGEDCPRNTGEFCPRNTGEICP